MFRLSAVAASLACLAPTILAQASEYTIQWFMDNHCGYILEDGSQVGDGNGFNQTFTGNSGCAWFDGYDGQGDPDNYHFASGTDRYWGSFQLLFTGTEGNGELHPTVFSDNYCMNENPSPEAAFTLNGGTLGTIDTPGCYTISSSPITAGYIITQDGA